MRVFVGTYTGQLAVLRAEGTELALVAVTQLSENSIRALAVTQGHLVAGGYDQELRTVNPHNGAEERQAKESQGIVNCIVQVGKGMTAVGLDNGQIRFWDVAGWTCRKTLREHKKGVTDLKVDAKGLLLVSAAGRQLVFWNIHSQTSLYHYKFDFEINHILLVDSFEYLFLLGDRTIRQMTTSQNKELCRKDISEKIQCGVIFLDFLIIATEKGQIRIWKHGNFEHCIHFKAHEGRVKGMKVVGAGGIDCLVTAEANGEISVWDILQFLRGVEALSQDYPLQGLKPLSSVKTKQRIICLEAISLEEEQKPEEEQEEAEAQVEQQPKKSKKQKSHKKTQEQPKTSEPIGKQKKIRKQQRQGK